MPFEEKEGMEGHHKVLEDGDNFESSFLRLDRCCFMALLRVDTFFTTFLESTEIAFGKICLPGREAKLFQSNCLTTGFSVPSAGINVG